MIFLNKHKDLPIVAHGVKHDRDKVLTQAFKKVDNLDALPPKERWRCSLDLADEKKIPTKYKSLDDLLVHFNLAKRDEDVKHDALKDARLAAQVYMCLMKAPKPKKTTLGFPFP